MAKPSPRPVVSRIDRTEFAGPQLREAAGFMANPKRSVRVFKQTRYPAIPQFRRVAGVKYFEPHAIESHQPLYVPSQRYPSRFAQWR